MLTNKQFIVYLLRILHCLGLVRLKLRRKRPWKECVHPKQTIGLLLLWMGMKLLLVCELR